MIGDLKPYAMYKDSGVPWLGQTPSHWEVRRLKSSLVRNDSGFWGSDFSPVGPYVLRSNEQSLDGRWRIVDPARRALTAREESASRLAAGDLVITKSSGSANHIGKTTLVTREIASMGCCFSNFMQRIRMNQSLLPKIAWYWLNCSLGRDHLVHASSSTTGLANLNGSVIGNLWFAVPTLSEQSAIVRFLDHADRRIQRYIRAKRKLIALLNEQKQAIIHRAVIRGLDPDVRLKSSGVEWLGEVPEHWGVSQIRSLAYVVRGSSPRPAGSALYFHGTGMPWITVGEITKDSGMHLTSTATRLTPAGEECSRTIEAGTLLLTNSGATLGVPKISLIQGCINDGVAALLRPRVSREFLFFYLTTQTAHLKAWVSLGAQPNLNTQIIGGWPALVPSAAEQNQIVEYVTQETATIMRALEQTHDEVALLQEFRTRLIADVVTGKLDVREAAARLPEEAEELEALEDGGLGEEEPEGEELDELPEDAVA